MAKDVPVAASGKLQVVKISSGVSNYRIKCDCAGGPPNGENIVLCRVCNVWHHQRCQIGMEALLPQAARIKGYNCAGCKTKARSDSAKAARARDADWRNEGIAQRAALTAIAKDKVAKSTKRRSGLGRRNSVRRASRYESEDDDDEDEDGDEDQEGMIPDFEGEDDDDVQMSPAFGAEDQVDNNKFGEAASTSSLRSKLRPASRAQRHLVRNNAKDNMATGNSTLGGPYQLSAKDRKDVHRLLDLTKQEPCRCLGDVVDAGTTLTVCYDCGALHREDCAGDPSTDKFGRGNFCRECKAIREREVKDALKWFEMKKIHDRDVAFACQLDDEDARKARQDQEDQEDQQDQENRQDQEHEDNYEKQEGQQEALRAFCAGFLWKTYALLPNTASTSAVVKELTAFTFDMGERCIIPIHPAPASFVAQLYDALVEMLNVAGQDNVAKVAGHDNAMLSPQNPEQMLIGLRQLGVMVVHQTERSMGIEAMGVLAEVLGLASKGAYWSG